MKPSFSAIIPAFNAEKTITQAIHSCINQTYPPLEIIIINDGSTDRTEELVRDIKRTSAFKKIKIITFKNNKGVSRARNAGLEIAKADYIAFLDADDIWHKWKLEIMAMVISHNSNYHLFSHEGGFTDIILYKSDRKFNPRLIEVKRFRQFLLRNPIFTPCTIIRNTDIFRFNDNLTHTEDHDLWLKIASQYNCLMYHLPLTKIERHLLSTGGISSDRLKMRIGEMKMYVGIYKYKKNMLPFIPLLVLFSGFKHIAKQLGLITANN